MESDATKCKELVNDFKKFKHYFESLVVSDKNLTQGYNNTDLNETRATGL